MEQEEEEVELRRRMSIVRLVELSGARDIAWMVANSPAYPGFVPASEETTESVLERIGTQKLHRHKDTITRHLKWINAAAESIADVNTLQRSHNSRMEDQRQFDLCLAY